MNGLPQGYPPQVSAPDFLASLGPAIGNSVWLTQSHGPLTPHPRLENGGFAFDVLPQLRDDCGHYYSQAMIQPGARRRANDTFKSAWVFVLDDLGLVGSITKAKLDINLIGSPFGPEPSYMVETSQGCFQGAFVLSPMVGDTLKWQCFQDVMKRHPIWGPGLDGAGDLTHLYRLPTGINPKTGFRTRLYRAFNGLTYSLDELAALFGVDISPRAVVDYFQKLPSASTTVQWSIPHLEGVMAHIANDQRFDHRDRWLGVAHAIANVTLNEPEEGRRVFVAWTMTWVDASGKKPRQKPAEIERVWDTLPGDHKAGAGTLRKLAEEAHPGDFKVRSAVAGPDAALTAIEPEAVVELAIDKLLAEIAKLSKAPAHQAVPLDDNWLGATGLVRTLRSTLGSPRPAPPIMVDPHTRGLVSVIGGMAGKGKSLLILQQALAVVCDDRALIRANSSELLFTGDVVYVSNEDGLNVILRRADGWAKHHGIDLSSTPHDLIPLRSTLVSQNSKGEIRIECLRILRALHAHKLAGKDIAMIVIDTLPASVSGFGENDNDEMKEVQRFLERLARAFWCSIVFIHHVRKNNPEGDEEPSILWLRGAGSTGGAVRGGVIVTPTSEKDLTKYGWAGKKMVTEHVVKASDGEDGQRFYYEFELVETDVQHAQDPTRVVKRKTPVLVPRATSTPVSDFKKQAEALKKLRDYVGVIRDMPTRTGRKAGVGYADTPQDIMGLNDAVTKDLLDIFERDGHVRRVKWKDPERRKDVDIIEVIGLGVEVLE